MVDEKRADRITWQEGDLEIVSFADKSRPVPKPGEDWRKFVIGDPDTPMLANAEPRTESEGTQELAGLNSEQIQIIFKSLQIRREDVFPANSQMPVSEQEDAKLPQIGFIGEGYRPGGDILIAINPGGGGDGYHRTAEDSILLPMIEALQMNVASLEAAKAVFRQYADNMQNWNLWRIVKPTLDACGRSQSEVAYFNWCPFRTRKDAMPHAPAMRRCLEIYLEPLIAKLSPGRVIALGKKAGNWVVKEKFGDVPRFVIPRTNGDTYVSAEAREVLSIIKRAKS